MRRTWIVRERPEERFAFLTLEGVHLMLEEAAASGRLHLSIRMAGA
jgi:hypothetical protein